MCVYYIIFVVRDSRLEDDTRHYTRAQSLKILKEHRDVRRKVHA